MRSLSLHENAEWESKMFDASTTKSWQLSTLGPSREDAGLLNEAHRSAVVCFTETEKERRHSQNLSNTQKLSNTALKGSYAELLPLIINASATWASLTLKGRKKTCLFP